MLDYFTFFKNDVIAIYKHLLSLERDIETNEKQWEDENVIKYLKYLKRGYYNRAIFIKRLSKQRIDIVINRLNDSFKRNEEKNEEMYHAFANLDIGSSKSDDNVNEGRVQTWDAFEDERLDEKTFTVNVGTTDPDKARESMTKLMNNYKEEINFDADKTEE